MSRIHRSHTHRKLRRGYSAALHACLLAAEAAATMCDMRTCLSRLTFARRTFRRKCRRRTWVWDHPKPHTPHATALFQTHTVSQMLARPCNNYRYNCEAWRSRQARCQQNAEPTDAENRRAKHFARNRSCGVLMATTDSYRVSMAL